MLRLRCFFRLLLDWETGRDNERKSEVRRLCICQQAVEEIRTSFIEVAETHCKNTLLQVKVQRKQRETASLAPSKVVGHVKHCKMTFRFLHRTNKIQCVKFVCW